ncbi:MAG: DegT/DnrJ/EryC1/StrS family aminotransferase [Candidatus Woesearchaeota archaeon]
MKKIEAIAFFGKDKYYKAYSEDIISIMKKVYSHGRVVMGPEVEEFEEKLASYCGRKHAVAVGSCTDALYFSLVGAGIKPGDEVLVTGFSFIASASCILRVGAVPVFVDINPENYMMDLADLERKITEKTRAIVAVPLFGNAMDLDAVEEIGKKHSLVVIEDAAQSIGGRHGDRKVGSMGQYSCISFDPTKILSAQSNGGVVLTDDPEKFELVSKMRYHGKNLKTGEFEVLGYNSRLASLQAALLSYNLDRLESWIERHSEIARQYIEGLEGLVHIPKLNQKVRHVFHKFVIQTNDRDKLKDWLKQNGIQAMVHYGESIPENKLFGHFTHRADGLKHIDELKKKVLSLPIHPWLKDEEVGYIIREVRNFFSKKG